jgi:hypothetical protein
MTAPRTRSNASEVSTWACQLTLRPSHVARSLPALDTALPPSRSTTGCHSDGVPKGGRCLPDHSSLVASHIPVSSPTPRLRSPRSWCDRRGEGSLCRGRRRGRWGPRALPWGAGRAFQRRPRHSDLPLTSSCSMRRRSRWQRDSQPSGLREGFQSAFRVGSAHPPRRRNSGSWRLGPDADCMTHRPMCRLWALRELRDQRAGWVTYQDPANPTASGRLGQASSTMRFDHSRSRWE